MYAKNVNMGSVMNITTRIWSFFSPFGSSFKLNGSLFFRKQGFKYFRHLKQLICIKSTLFSISNMVWNGGSINLPEIDVFGPSFNRDTKRKKNHQQKSNEIKILRTVAESDTHRSKEAIAFTPDLEHVPLGKVRKINHVMVSYSSM